MNQVFLEIGDMELTEKRVLIREDYNVPLEDGKITNDERIVRTIATIRLALAADAKVMLMSHLGRPQEGEVDATYSLACVAEALSKHLNQPVKLAQNWLEGVDVGPGEVVLLENVRFNKGEKANDDSLARKIAGLCDIFVMDAFATSHRSEASTVGVAKYAPLVCAGPLLIEELNSLSAACDSPMRPLVAVVGGSKVSTKIALLDALVDKVDQLLVGGGIANTFIKAAGFSIGKSLYEPDWVEKVKKLQQKAQAKGVEIPLPRDVVVAKTMSAEAKSEIKALADIADDDCIFDVGPETQASYPALFENAKTIVWNGPVGVFEIESFSVGTKAMAEAIANSSAFSLAGGGDTLAALEKFGVSDKISYISTGGGAFLAYLQGEALPAVKILQQRLLR